MPDASKVTIEQPKQVLVEGMDDSRVFTKLAEDMGMPDVQIQRYDGYQKLRPFLKNFIALSGFGLVRSLAVVADANSSRIDREKSIRDALSDRNLPSPPGPLQVSSDSNLQVAYLVLPHDRDCGMIEDICLDSVSTDPAIQCVDQYFECIGQAGLPGPKDTWMSKARVYAFLASREDPSLRLGEAAQRGTWPLESDAFRPLRELLNLL